MRWRRPNNPFTDAATSPLSEAFLDGLDAMIDKLCKLPRYTRTNDTSGTQVGCVANYDMDVDQEILRKEVYLIAVPKELIDKRDSANGN